ncbi:MAG: hypothetical protein ACYTAF_12420 [Planctomycetota bacterium]|jgi:hypothetical protein
MAIFTRLLISSLLSPPGDDASGVHREAIPAPSLHARWAFFPLAKKIGQDMEEQQRCTNGGVSTAFFPLELRMKYSTPIWAVNALSNTYFGLFSPSSDA